MFGFLTGIKGMLIAAAISAAVAGIAGWKARDAFCDAAEAKAKVASLERQLKARDEADKINSEKALEDSAAIETLQGKINELQVKISAGVCFTPADTDRVRKLWD